MILERIDNKFVTPFSYSSKYFFNYHLVAIALLPVSMILYAVFKKLMGDDDDQVTRKTIFWSNKRPTMVAILTGLVSTVVLTVLMTINILGRHSSSFCDLPPDLHIHGLVTSLPTGKVQFRLFHTMTAIMVDV